MTRPAALTPVEAYEAIQAILQRSDTLSFTSHARQRARERCFDADDIHKVLTCGMVAPNPEWDEQFQDWKYTVRGRDCDNDPLAVVIAIEPEFDRITIITGKDC